MRNALARVIKKKATQLTEIMCISEALPSTPAARNYLFLKKPINGSSEAGSTIKYRLENSKAFMPSCVRWNSHGRISSRKRHVVKRYV